MSLDEDILNASECHNDDEFLFDIYKPVVLQDDTDTKDEYFAYKVLSTEQLVQHMNDCIDEVTAIIETKPTITRILLNHFNWNQERLYERYFDGNQENLFIEAHINPFRSFSNLERKETASEVLEICLICFSGKKVESLMCGHQFCSDCLRQYLTIKIMEEGMGQTISCAAHKCDILIDDQIVMKLIKDVKVKLRYQLLITNSFVECNRLLQWCPQVGCNNVIKAQWVAMQPVICNCGHKFCFSCSENWHDPVNCHLVKKWKKSCQEEAKNMNWLKKNTKQCPNCNVSIEKNGGCNHMTCSNKNCNLEFCWICLQKWDSHFSCMYENNNNNNHLYITEKSLLDSQKYSFYYERYMKQVKSLKVEAKLYTKEKFEEVNQYLDISRSEIFLFEKAVSVLRHCRQTLMYTFIFAFYVKGNNQFDIFVENQIDLENATNKFSVHLKDVTNKELTKDMKARLQDQYEYCKSRHKVLLNHVHEGYELNCYKFKVWHTMKDNLCPLCYPVTKHDILCCKCGISIEPNPANMCVPCIRTDVDITEGIPKQVVIYFCNGCERYLRPPAQWIACSLESKELLSLCLSKLRGLNQVHLIDARFIWTEPHSRRIKIKLTVQKEVMGGAILQQVVVIEYTVNNQMCDACHRREAKDFWNSVVQVRQKVDHKRTFLHLEQVILKHKVHTTCLNIKNCHDGLDFYFGKKDDARKFVDFLQLTVPCRVNTSQRLISHDVHSNVYNYKHTFSVEIVPICKHDVVCLPPQLARCLKSISQLCVCYRVTTTVHLIDPISLQIAELSSQLYWRYPFKSLSSLKQLTEYTVMENEHVQSSKQKNATQGCFSQKHILSDVWIVKSTELGLSDPTHCRTHIGHLLNPGDTVLGFDLAKSNFNDLNFEKLKTTGNAPDVILLKKIYETRKREKSNIESEDNSMSVDMEEEDSYMSDW